MRRSTALRAIASTAGLLSAVLVVSACAADSSSADDVISIGASLPLTGEFSQGGLDTQQGYETWVAMTNENGGLLGKDVEIIVKDDSTNQNTVVTNYNNLISEDGVDLLIGSNSSLLNIPASAIAERNKMVFICPSCGSPDMFNRGFEYIFFGQQAVATDQAKVFAEWVVNLPEDQRPATVAYPTLDDPFATPVAEGAEKILSAAGIKTVYKDLYPPTTKNFDAIVSAVKQSGAEMVFQGSQFEDGVNMIRSLNRADYAPEILYQSTAPTFGDQYLEGVGADSAQGVFFASSYNVAAATPNNAEFVAKFKELFGKEPPEDAADGFAAAEILGAAAEAVGSIDDQKALADWLHSNEVPTILGTLSWNEDGSPTGEYLVGQWQDGVSHVVLPSDASTTESFYRWRGEAFQAQN